jgi:hypothetical protein
LRAAQVDLSHFDATHGPRAFTNYTLTCMGIAILGTVLFTRFLPDSRVMCHEWRKQGQTQGGGMGQVGILTF